MTLRIVLKIRTNGNHDRHVCSLTKHGPAVARSNATDTLNLNEDELGIQEIEKMDAIGTRTSG